MTSTVPHPRTPLPLEEANGESNSDADGHADGTARWYEHELGWAVAGGLPVHLLTGLRFDVLELPADAGFAVLRRCGALTGPVALMGQRMRLLVAAGSAEELPGLLDWLEWGGVALELRALGAGGRMTAPAPPGRVGPQGAAVWLRPPEPGREVEPTLPAFAGLGCRGDAPDLVRLVGTAATECHRARLLRATVHYRGSTPGSAAASQPLAFS